MHPAVGRHWLGTVFVRLLLLHIAALWALACQNIMVFQFSSRVFPVLSHAYRDVLQFDKSELLPCFLFDAARFFHKLIVSL